MNISHNLYNVNFFSQTSSEVQREAETYFYCSCYNLKLVIFKTLEFIINLILGKVALDIWRFQLQIFFRFQQRC